MPHVRFFLAIPIRGAAMAEEATHAIAHTFRCCGGKIGLTREYVARLETGHHDPGLSVLVRRAKPLKLKVGELVEYLGKTKESQMKTEVFRKLTGCHVIVDRIRRGDWDAFLRMVPVQGTGTPGEGELVPGGPFPTRDAAGNAGVAYAKTKTR